MVPAAPVAAAAVAAEVEAAIAGKKTTLSSRYHVENKEDRD